MKTQLPADVCPYRRTPEFTQSTVPAALLRHHTTKPGGWAVIHALEGQLEYRILQPADERHLLTSDQPGLVEPTVPHEVVPLGQVRCYVEFHARGRVRRRRSARLILPHFRRVSSGVADGESWSIRMACVSTQSGFSERRNPHETNDFWWSLVWALSLTPAFAADAGHEHPHDAPPAKLQLDAGKKWQTDATLRQSMAELRQLFASKLLPRVGEAGRKWRLAHRCPMQVAPCRGCTTAHHRRRTDVGRRADGLPRRCCIGTQRGREGDRGTEPIR